MSIQERSSRPTDLKKQNPKQNIKILQITDPGTPIV